ncbi:hypothetical protein INN71_11310 [Nocardioides sp. ChNu-153]|uniref:hypothetical protein n=1 Tax=unclassified Nocardioides TaxID=2615069 RepID=UPI002404E3F4|nr:MULTISPECIES: hypothetical protein [unclassified Nocardioides]MDF9716278.1 hypothetical protein [Nocardioides sp. ChNu-99]MDN7121980.1 hypothetical protein [Nocardioides sp. ChNu-153]
MSSPTRPRRRHPARVYWVRRGLVLGVAALLVVAIARLLGGGGDEEPAGEPAAQVAGEASPTAEETGDAAPTTTAAEPTTTQPASPTGPCAPEDVVVTPQVEDAVAGSPVSITLALTTRESPACFWNVSSATVVVKVTSGEDGIWTSQHCPDAVARVDDAVLRPEQPAVATVEWPAWRSGPGCELMQWSLPGAYHVEAAALAGEPTDVQFELVAPEPEIIERTIPPTAPPATSAAPQSTAPAPTAPATTG